MIRRLLLVLALACAVAAGAGPAHARGLHALILGVNAYPTPNELYGAVNDAQALAAALKPISASQTVLLDRQVTPAGVRQAWAALLAKAQPGDTILMSFSGHGGHEAETAPDGAKRARPIIMLAGYAPAAWQGDPTARLRDDELRALFDAAKPKGLRVIFIADSCHSGNLTRSLDPRARGVRKRSIGLLGDVEASLGAAPKPALGTGDRPFPEHVTFIAAALDDETALELQLDGQQHGALTYSLLNILKGAGADADGRVTRGGLDREVRRLVRAAVDAKQTPSVKPADKPDEVLFALPRQIRVEPTAEPPPPPPRLLIHAKDEATAARLAGSLVGVQRTTDAAAFDLAWIEEERQVLSARADVIAFDVGQDRLQAVVDKEIARRRVDKLAAGRGLDSRLEPSDGRHPEGAPLVWTASGLQHSHLVLFSLAADGTVQLHYPQAGDPLAIDIGQPLSLRFKAASPYGRDDLVTLVTARPAQALIDALKAYDGQRRAIDAAAVLRAALAGGGYQLATQPIFTVR